MFGFVDRIARGFTLAGMSFKVLWLDKELLLFPLMSLIALALVYGGILSPFLLTGGMETFLARFENPEALMNDPAYWVVLFIFYVLTSFVVIFFNAALIFCAMIRLHGGDPTVMDGLRSSWRVLPQIFAWALFASTVKLLIDLVASRSDFLSRLIAGAMNLAWGIATYFAVPVLVIEEVGPIDAIRQSAATIRKTWGEALTSHLGLGTLQGLVIFLCLIPAFTGSEFIETDPPRAIWNFALSAGLVFLVTLVGITLNGIVRAALYIYAVKGHMPGGLMDERVLKEAFGPK